jgi:hypothetical protein
MHFLPVAAHDGPLACPITILSIKARFCTRRGETGVAGAKAHGKVQLLQEAAGNRSLG